ncbi:monocarboxylate transporter 5 [Trichogramma pretiosum]|uniref:Major facilitator superfamily (MFS) profile domain-containing protein n=1 Tax=Trichogramma kaykai TaxID=54128 RepID=A0ABD2VWI1_9HYME|nr:monocarboxylate transporter 5 [Trichogramma pretiosum]
MVCHKNGFNHEETNGVETTNVAKKEKETEIQSKTEDISRNSISISSDDDKYVAPDGGWGWMVTIGLIVVFVSTIGPCSSFTIVFGDFLASTGQEGSVMTMLNSLFNISFSLAGLVTDSLLKQFSMRTIGIVAAILYAVPNVLLAFVRHIIEMAVIFLIQGVGLGLMFTICNTNFNAYFDKKRSKIMGISQVIVGAGYIVYPIIIEVMLEEYGFRGTSAITGALSLHCIAGMALMIPPPNWKIKKPYKEIDKLSEKTAETEKLLEPIKTSSGSREVKKLKREEKWYSSRSLQEDDQIAIPEMEEKNRVSSATDVEAGSHRNRSKSLFISGKVEWPKSRKNALLAGYPSSSLTNVRVQPGTESFNNAILQLQNSPILLHDKSRSIDEESNDKSTKIFIRSRRILDNLIDFSLLKDAKFLNMCLGISFVFASDFTFAAFLPMMMASRGFGQSEATFAITTSATTELVSRVFLAAFTLFFDVRPKLLFFFAMIGMTIAKIGYLCLEDTLIGSLIMVGVIGAVRSWLLVPQPLVVVEDVGVDQFAAAYGIFAIVSGVISVIFGPLSGLIKDWTESFIACQVVLLIMNALFIVPWTVELICNRNKSKTSF